MKSSAAAAARKHFFSSSVSVSKPIPTMVIEAKESFPLSIS